MTAQDPVAQAAVRRWCTVLGDHNPVYVDESAARASVHGRIIAPPAMLAAWTMAPYGDRPAEPDAIERLYAALNEAGYSAIVATNSEQDYLRELALGDRVAATKTIESVSEVKQTALGSGVFITTTAEVVDGDGEVVGRHLHRVLKYRPRASAAATEAPIAVARRPRPVMTKDTAFFWEGARRHRLLIQRCANCGILRHPPTAACANCGSLEWDAVESSGRGKLYSYTVVHAPIVPPFEAPHVVALVELEEGTRLVSELAGIDPSDVRIGMPLRCDWLDADPELTLPVFRPPRPEAGMMAVGDRLAPLRVPLTRSFVVCAALASGDYEPMHHDPAAARARGLPDIFMNIHSTNGLVGRLLTDWAGPDATLRRIALRLGAPMHPQSTLEISGTVTEVDGSEVTIALRGRSAYGDHLDGSARLTMPQSPAAP
jgi:uncharacterized OB-fold protein/acyl dehydratase